MEYQSKIRFLVNLSFTATIGLIIYISGKFLLDYLFPFVISAIIAWWVQRPARVISSRLRVKTGSCAAVISGVIFLAVAAIITVAVFGLISAARTLFDYLPKISDWITDFFYSLKPRFSDIFKNPSSLSLFEGFSENITNRIFNSLYSALSSFAASAAKKAPSMLFSSVVALVASVYMAKDYKKLTSFLKELCGVKIFTKALEIKNIIVENVLKLVKGYFILMVITFFVLLLGFFALGIKNAFILALIVSFIDLLPVLGTGTVLIPWGIILLLLGDGKGFFILLLYLIAVLVRNFSEPKIIGDKIGIYPLFTLIFMFAGLKSIGFWGLILLPLTFIVIFEYYRRQSN